MELGFMDLMQTAAVICDVTLKPKPGEKIVILADSRNHEYHGQEPLIEALMAVMAERGLDPTMIYYEGRTRSNMNIPEIAALAVDNADIVVAETSLLILQSQAMMKIMRNKHTRCIMLPSGSSITASPDEIYRLMPRTKEELLEVSDLMDRTGEMLKGTPKVHFSAANGTDMNLSLVPLSIYPDDGIAIHDGLCDRPGRIAIIPPGSIVCTAADGTVNGKMVLDGETSLYVGLIDSPVTLTFENGLVTNVEGSGTAATAVRNFLNGLDASGQSNEMFEYGMGFNPKAKLNGNPSEGEFIYGCVHVGVGFMTQNHFDAIIPNASAEIEGVPVLKDGKYL